MSILPWSFFCFLTSFVSRSQYMQNWWNVMLKRTNTMESQKVFLYPFYRISKGYYTTLHDVKGILNDFLSSVLLPLYSIHDSLKWTRQARGGRWLAIAMPPSSSSLPNKVSFLRVFCISCSAESVIFSDGRYIFAFMVF